MLGLVWLLIRFTSISVLTIQTRKQSLLYLFVGLSHIIPGWCVVYLSIHWSTINSLLIDRFKVCHNFAQLVQKEDNSQHKKQIGKSSIMSHDFAWFGCESLNKWILPMDLNFEYSFLLMDLILWWWNISSKLDEKSMQVVKQCWPIQILQP